MKTFTEFANDVYTTAAEYPACIRKGQGVFNAVEELFGSQVARNVQFVEGVDCFYNDNAISEFLTVAYWWYLKTTIVERNYTSIQQSEELLKCGLPEYTADMVYLKDKTVSFSPCYPVDKTTIIGNKQNENVIPIYAWSLGAMINILEIAGNILKGDKLYYLNDVLGEYKSCGNNPEIDFLEVIYCKLCFVVGQNEFSRVLGLYK